MEDLSNNELNNLQPNKPEVKVYKAEVVENNNSENSYREKTTTIREKEIVGNGRPKSSISQIILAICAFITITFAVYDKVLRPYLQENKIHQTVISSTGNIEAQLSECKNNGKFVLIDCYVTNKSSEENVTFYSNGKVVDASGKSANTVFVQPDGSNSFNISDTSEKIIDLPNGVPVRIRLMYNFKTKEESLAYASFVTSLGKIEFRDVVFSK